MKGILLAAACILAAALAMSFFCYCIAFFSPLHRKVDVYDIPAGEQYQAQRAHMRALIGEMAAIACETVAITSYDGVRLTGRYYHVRDGAPLQIEFHGYRGSAIRDFCGGNKLARQAGLNTLAVDQRAHGKSGGRTISFGLRERYDCQCWVNYACDRWPGVPITLAGVSMGATTVLMAAGLDLPPAVRGVIADCPFNSPRDIIRKVCRDVHLPPAAVYPFLRLGARLFGGFDPDETTAAREIVKSRLPILILHGEDDRFVPCDMSREIYDACPGPKRRVTFPGAGHGLSFIVDPEKYAAAVRDFLAGLSSAALLTRAVTVW